MKQVPIQLLTSLKKPGRSTTFLIKVVSKQDGSVYPFTTLDAVVRFNDGIHNLLYSPTQSLRPQNIQNVLDMEVDTTELHGWFDDVMEQAALAGLLSSAEITIYRVSYQQLSYGAEVVGYGTVGFIEYSANRQGTRKVEFRGLDHALVTKQNDQYSLTCRHGFGDGNCGMPLIWEPGTIIAVEDPFMRFQVSGIARPDDYFRLGVVGFLDGANANAELEIETWTDDGWVTLGFPTPYAMVNGVLTRLRQDCDKTESACLAYGNIVNMGAEHLTPVQDQSLMVPGAYIKSSNSL